MYDDAKKMLAKKHYASISELIRDALRRLIYQEVSDNGFTNEFEDKILQSAAEPIEKDKTWETEGDIRSYFQDLDKKIAKHDKD